jgi:hypothetical protein
MEVEPNNDPTTANAVPAVTSTFCGHLEPGDVDFVTFTMPQSVGEFGFSQFGFVNVVPSVGGQTFDFNGNYPFIPGGKYVLQISSQSGQATDYRIGFTFQPF